MKRIGEYYRETVMSLPKKERELREFEHISDELTIERDLFGWQLYSDKKYIECRSEEEARYLRVFFSMGLNEIYVPKNDEYLKSILPELEKLKKRTDEIIDDYLYGILSRKKRAQIRHAVYMEITAQET
ncbi:hypothetical protein AMJ80_01925 [bacterium SM23_31]|nr:MAG: hypothetical protein AMJ80_01925 [bacterium SM23_31]